MIKSVLFASLLLFGCASNPKTFESCEDVSSLPSFEERADKISETKLNDREQVFIKYEVRRCETRFDEGAPLECGIEVQTDLVWASGERVIDRAELESEGCERPEIQSYHRVKKFKAVDLTVKKDRILVRHTFEGDLGPKAKDEDYCRVEVYEANQKTKKLVHQPFQKCAAQ